MMSDVTTIHPQSQAICPCISQDVNLVTFVNSSNVMLRLCQLLGVLNPDRLQLDCDSGGVQTRLKPPSHVNVRGKLESNIPPPHYFACAVPFAASWLPGIQIVQMNGLEFLESLNSDNVLTSSEGSCEIQPFP